MTNGSLMKAKDIAVCSRCSILQYFWPALSDNWSWKAIFGLLQRGRFAQILQYKESVHFMFQNIILYHVMSLCYHGYGAKWNIGPNAKKNRPNRTLDQINNGSNTAMVEMQQIN